VIYLDLDDLLHVAARTLGEVQVRDIGLLEAALARPQSTAFGEDAYPSIHGKAAALLHSLARNHALVDGNKRTAWYATWVFLHMNGHPLDAGFDVDEAERFVLDVSQGALDVPKTAAELPRFAR